MIQWCVPHNTKSPLSFVTQKRKEAKFFFPPWCLADKSADHMKLVLSNSVKTDGQWTVTLGIDIRERSYSALESELIQFLMIWHRLLWVSYEGILCTNPFSLSRYSPSMESLSSKTYMLANESESSLIDVTTFEHPKSRRIWILKHKAVIALSCSLLFSLTYCLILTLRLTTSQTNSDLCPSPYSELPKSLCSRGFELTMSN